MAKLKVMHIITGLNPGGAERVVYDLCKHLDQERFDNLVVVMSQKDILVPVFLDSSIQTIPLKMKRNPVSFFRGLQKIQKVIRSERVHLIHAHMYHAMVAGVCLKKMNPGLPLVFTPHNVKMGTFLRDLTSFLLRPFRDIDVLFAPYHKKYFLKDSYRVIPNGIAFKEPVVVPKFEKFTFLMVGRLEPVKNHLAVLPIVRKLKSTYSFQILIAGTGELEHRIEEKIRELELEDVVQLLGFRTDIQELCSRSHVMLLPSLWEGFPIVLLEAGLSRLPVISRPVGSIPELIDPKTGYLCEINGFEDQMIHVMNNYSEAKNKGEALYNKIKDRFNMQKIASMHEEMYNNLLHPQK